MACVKSCCPYGTSGTSSQPVDNSANNGAGYEAKRSTSSTDPLDQYMLAATGELVREVTEALDSYEVSDATEAVRHYMDTLTNWYVRRSRQRFFDEDTQAFDTLYTALETLVKVSASLLPLASEEIFRGLTGERSVHLTDWPDANDFPADTVLLETMDTTRKICSVGSSLRKAKKPARTLATGRAEGSTHRRSASRRHLRFDHQGRTEPEVSHPDRCCRSGHRKLWHQPAAGGQCSCCRSTLGERTSSKLSRALSPGTGR